MREKDVKLRIYQSHRQRWFRVLNAGARSGRYRGFR